MEVGASVRTERSHESASESVNAKKEAPELEESISAAERLCRIKRHTAPRNHRECQGFIGEEGQQSKK